MSTATASTIDKRLKEIRTHIAALEKTEKLLTRAGCTLAHAHFKTGSNKMYLLDPVDANGKRKFTYIGVDPIKQQAARDAIDRYRQREAVRREIGVLHSELYRLNNDISSLINECKSAVRYAKQQVKSLALAG